jgi:hypothetical protein
MTSPLLVIKIQEVDAQFIMDPWSYHLNVQLQPAGNWYLHNYRIHRTQELLGDLVPHEDQEDLEEENCM